VLDWVKKHHLAQIKTVLQQLRPDQPPEVLLEIGSSDSLTPPVESLPKKSLPANRLLKPLICLKAGSEPDFTFETFVEGNSNQIARAACLQVTQNPARLQSTVYLRRHRPG